MPENAVLVVYKGAVFMQFAFDADFLLWIQEHLRCDFLNYIFPNITVLGNA